VPEAGTNDLEVFISDNPDPAQVGGVVSYNVTVLNNGPDNANNVTLFNQLPAGATLTNIFLSQGTVTNLNGVLLADIGIITNGRAATMRIDVVPNSIGSISNIASVIAVETDSNPANNLVIETTAVGAVGASLTVSGTTNAQTLAAAVIATNNIGLVVRQTTLNSHSPDTNTFSAGTFQAGARPVPYNLPGSGIVISSGNIMDYGAGPNTSPGLTTVFGVAATVVQENILDSITGDQTNNFQHFDVTQFDVVFDVKPGFEILTFTLAFGSEEFPEFVGSLFIDGFGIFLNGVNQTVVNGLPININHTNMLPLQGTELDGVLAPGSDPLLTFSIPVMPGSSNNVLSFILADTSDPLMDTTVYISSLEGIAAEADLTLFGVATPEPVAVGSSVTYSITLNNLGPDGATNVVVTNVIPAGAHVVSTALSQGVSVITNNTLEIHFGNLSRNQSVIAAVELQPTLFNRFTNTFTVGSLSRDDNVQNNTLSLVTTVVDPGSLLNSAPIMIADAAPAVTYPSIISISNVLGMVTNLTITLDGLTHSFPADVDALLQGPQGQSVVLMSDVGGGTAIQGAVLKFDDAATNGLSPLNGITNGVFFPTNYLAGDFFPPPAPGTVTSNRLAAFNGTDPNGNWSLYLMDDQGGDAGQLEQGWRLALTVAAPLQINQNGQLLSISIPDSAAANYVLESSDLAPPTPVWIPVTNGITVGGGFMTISINNSGGLKFYRVRQR
jgi:uncharacterized repeat protein (TIGR01451 family)